MLRLNNTLFRFIFYSISLALVLYEFGHDMISCVSIPQSIGGGSKGGHQGKLPPPPQSA